MLTQAIGLCADFYDRNNDKKLSREEFLSLIRRDAKFTVEMLPDQAIHKLFASLDRDKTGALEIDEFILW